MKSADPIRTLTHRHLDGAASPEEMSQLALTLLENPEAARAFAEITRLEAGLTTHFRSEKSAAVVRSVIQPPAARRFASPRWMAAAAAVAALASGLAWWRPWAGKTVMIAGSDGEKPAEHPRMATLPPSEARRRAVAAGTTLSPEVAAFQSFASRYWLPDPLDFQGVPVSAALAAVREQAGKFNHLKNALINGLSVDVSDEIAAKSVTASRHDLPLRAWLEILAAEAGCSLEWKADGVAFVPVDEPDELETRRFSLPDVPSDTTTADGKKVTASSAADPFVSEPQFAPAAWETGRFAAWVKADPLPNTRFVLRDAHTLEVRHTRRTLRQIEARLAVLDADARRPEIAYRAKEVPAVAANAAAMPKQPLNVWFIQTPNAANSGQAHFTESLSYSENGRAADPPMVSYVEESKETPAVPKMYFVPSTKGIALNNWSFTPATPAPANSRVIGNGEIAALFPSEPAQLSTLDDLVLVNDAADTVRTEIGAAGEADANGARTALRDLIVSGRSVDETVVRTLRLSTTWQDSAGTAVQSDPLADAATVSTTLGTEATLELPGKQVAAQIDNATDSFIVSFDYRVPAEPTPQLTAKTRLEGEMIRLTGTFRPAEVAKLPTDFDVWLRPDQSFVLQTEDNPLAPPQNISSAIPVLSDLPALGRLFNRTEFEPPAIPQTFGRSVATPSQAEGADAASPPLATNALAAGTDEGGAVQHFTDDWIQTRAGRFDIGGSAVEGWDIAPQNSAVTMGPSRSQQIVISPQVRWQSDGKKWVW